MNQQYQSMSIHAAEMNKQIFNISYSDQDDGRVEKLDNSPNPLQSNFQLHAYLFFLGDIHKEKYPAGHCHTEIVNQMHD